MLQQAMECSDDTIEIRRLPCFTRLSQLEFSLFESKLKNNSSPRLLHNDCQMNHKALVQQRNVSRIVKGAIAGGFHVTTVKVDKDGAIVLHSSPEREEREEPRLPLKANEWDEVLKK